MTLISDAQARAHLRVDDCAEIIDLYVNAAEQWAMEYMDRNVYADQVDLDAAVNDGSAGDCPMVVNDLVRAGILVLLGHLYENRESVVVGTITAEVPLSAKSLLHPYRKGLGA